MYGDVTATLRSVGVLTHPHQRDRPSVLAGNVSQCPRSITPGFAMSALRGTPSAWKVKSVNSEARGSRLSGLTVWHEAQLPFCAITNRLRPRSSRSVHF